MAMDLVIDVYDATKRWPTAERHGLIDQVRRSAVSVPSNVAEGQGRSASREFLHSLLIARGSLAEIETQLLLAGRLGYQDEATTGALLERADETGRLLGGLIRSLR
jgi:four helix bundle protein